MIMYDDVDQDGIFNTSCVHTILFKCPVSTNKIQKKLPIVANNGVFNNNK